MREVRPCRRRCASVPGGRSVSTGFPPPASEPRGASSWAPKNVKIEVRLFRHDGRLKFMEGSRRRIAGSRRTRLDPRPAGRSSRIRRGRGRRGHWTAPNGQIIELPVEVDILEIAPSDRSLAWEVVATVGLHAGEPRLERLVIHGPDGLDPVHLQNTFRWATPVEVVRRTLPILLERGIDPETFELPMGGFPRAALLKDREPSRLSDEFLAAIARRYLEVGRGYAKTIAFERGVSARTATSWIEKARERGILSRVRRGSHGGRISAPARRRRT